MKEKFKIEIWERIVLDEKGFMRICKKLNKNSCNKINPSIEILNTLEKARRPEFPEQEINFLIK